MGLFSSKVQMTPEEQAIHNEVKINFNSLNDKYNEFQRWLNRINETDSSYKKVLSCGELDSIILERTELDKVINALNLEYAELITKGQPFIQFMEKLQSKNIKFNNLNANEKKLLQEPLRANLQILNQWHEMRKEFDKKNEEMYNRVINYFNEAQIHNMNVYALKRMNIAYEERNDIVSKVKRVEAIYDYADILVGICKSSLPEVLYFDEEEDDEDNFWADNLNQLILLHKAVQAKFPNEKGEDSFFSTVDKKLKSAKKMFYYLDSFQKITNYLEILHKRAIDSFYCYTTIDDDDSSEELQELEISLQEAMLLIGVSPQYAKERIETDEASYGGRTVTTREIMIGRSLFSEVNDMLVSIELFKDYEMDLEEELVAETLGYEF
jgi:hypothetical protein